MSSRLSRRVFLHAPLVGVAASALSGGAAAARKGKQLKIGLASYSMRKQTLDQVIEFCKQSKVTHLTLKEMHLPLKSTPAELQAARDKLKAAGIELAGLGVIYMKSPEEVTAAFEYAKAAQAPLIVGAPSPEVLDATEAAVKQFNIPIAIHNHGPEDKHFPSPLDVLAAIKKRDKRVGICMDVGHTVRANVDPVKAVAQCGPRLFDIHAKDLTDKADKNSRTEVGMGVIDQVALLSALVKHRFHGHVALEYEIKPDDPIPGIRESLAYLRGVAAALGA
jgi:sugar phosphate isomerase/epimerase